ncbi:hypothetical protein CR513_11746, partial [Mucuna pruriens]
MERKLIDFFALDDSWVDLVKFLGVEGTGLKEETLSYGSHHHIIVVGWSIDRYPTLNGQETTLS